MRTGYFTKCIFLVFKNFIFKPLTIAPIFASTFGVLLEIQKAEITPVT